MPDEPVQHKDGKADTSHKAGWGSMGLGGLTTLGNMTAMMVLIVFAVRLDNRLAEVNNRLFDLIAENGQRNEKLTATFETHIATQIGETRENRASNDRLGGAVDKLGDKIDRNTQSNERLIWALGVKDMWPFGPGTKKD